MAMGDTLVSKGVISAGQLTSALDEQKVSGEKLGVVIVKLGFARQEAIDSALN